MNRRQARDPRCLGSDRERYEQTIPPQVSYGLTDRGRDLIGALDLLNVIAFRWQADSETRPGNPGGTGTTPLRKTA